MRLDSPRGAYELRFPLSGPRLRAPPTRLRAGAQVVYGNAVYRPELVFWTLLLRLPTEQVQPLVCRMSTPRLHRPYDLIGSYCGCAQHESGGPLFALLFSVQ